MSKFIILFVAISLVATLSMAIPETQLAEELVEARDSTIENLEGGSPLKRPVEQSETKLVDLEPRASESESKKRSKVITITIPLDSQGLETDAIITSVEVKENLEPAKTVEKSKTKKSDSRVSSVEEAKLEPEPEPEAALDSPQRHAKQDEEKTKVKKEHDTKNKNKSKRSKREVKSEAGVKGKKKGKKEQKKAKKAK